MRRVFFLGVLLSGVTYAPSYSEESAAMEWLLPGGTLYSMADQTYKSLRLPEGWFKDSLLMDSASGPSFSSP